MSESMNPGTYLDKKLEPMTELTEEEEEKQLQDIREILANFPPIPENKPRPKEAGEYRLGDFIVTFDFLELNPNDFYLDEPKEFLFNKLFDYEVLSKEEGEKLRSTMLIGEYKLDSPNRARQLGKFSLKNIHSDEVINVSTLLPDKYEIIYIPDDQSGGNVDFDTKKIFLRGDITNLDTMLTLLHEVGHAQIFSKWSDEESARYLRLKDRFNETMIEGGGDASNEEIAWVYKNERDAWAFVLSQIKKIFHNQTERKRYAPVMQAIDTYIHGYVLRKNSDIMRKVQDPNYKGMFAEILEKKGITEEEFNQKMKDFFEKSNENDAGKNQT